MTLVSSIISDAFRKTNLTGTETDPTTNEQTEALRHLNRLVKSVFGKEAGEDLVGVAIGSGGYVVPSDYPGYNTVPSSDWFVPENVRAVLNLEEAATLYLHPQPRDGARFAVLDVSENLSTYNLTVNANGRLIEGSSSLTLNTDSTNSEWFFRADLANWVKYSSLTLVDTFPFPEEFDNFFIIMLAMSINPGYGTSIDGQTQAMLARSRSQIKSRYSQVKQKRVELGLIRMSRLAADRDNWTYYDDLYDPQDSFNRGFN